MGNQFSKSPESPEEVLPTLSPGSQRKLNQMAHSNYFETTSLANDATMKTVNQSPCTSAADQSTVILKGKRKCSASSEESNNSSLTTGFRSTYLTPMTTPESNVSIVNNIKFSFEVLNGRRYLNSPGSHFFLPCDDEEADRLVILHFLIKYSFNGNMTAPVAQTLRTRPVDDNPTKVLDVGCGPGTWVLEMATEFPNAEFYGIDIRSMFPSSIKPTNAKFLQYDFLKDLPYADGTFEFVRMRLMLGFMTEKQLHHLVSEIQRVLKPLGYIEIQDVEYQIHRPGPMCENVLNRQLKHIMVKQNIDFMSSYHISALLMAQPLNGGFIDVHQYRVTVPIGWGGQLGDVHAQNFAAFLQSIHPRMKKDLVHNNTTVNLDNLIPHAIKECASKQSHMKWFVCYGRKPADNNMCMLHVTPPPSICSSVKINSIPTQYPPTANSSDTIPIITPVASTSLEKHEDQGAWESINDFADGYTD